MNSVIKYSSFLLLVSCTTEPPINRDELCLSIGQAYANCIIEYCSDNAPKYNWEPFFIPLADSINKTCNTSTNLELYSTRFLTCFDRKTCQEILMFDACKVDLQAKNYCGVVRLD